MAVLTSLESMAERLPCRFPRIVAAGSRAALKQIEGDLDAVRLLLEQAIDEARDLSRTLSAANAELQRLYSEQAASARTAIRLAQTQQQVSALRDADRIRRELLQNVASYP